ncbi:MAG: hypothetical protein ABI857_02610 [Acidobacteriota bacterium]
MHSPTIVIFTLILGFLTCSDKNLRSDESTDTPLAVVRQYVSFAHAGQFEKAESLVVSTINGKAKNPGPVAGGGSENKQERSNSNSTSAFTIVPDPRVVGKGTQDWIQDFARSIHDEKLSIRSVRKESASETEAGVEVILGNENREDIFGWVFLLRKADDNWKIYDITTAGG